MAESLELDVEPDLVQAAERRFVLVTGAGRSGTSTIAGSLNYLGLHLPRPVLGTNRSNPRGFFESRWAIDFHKRLMERANIDVFDARPDALQKIHDVLRPEHQQEIESWLHAEAAHAPQMVVKDPRSAWIPGLWADAAASLGFSTGYVTMLRHPAEVIGSRSTYYAKGDEEGVRRYQITNVARWVNANLVSERQTRGRARAFLRYHDLIEDWRGSVEPLGIDLGLTFNIDIDSGSPHVVDEFIDPSLRRHTVTWDELDIPPALQVVAEGTWQACGVLADGHGADEHAHARLDELSLEYEKVFRDAAAVAHDVMAGAVKVARKKAIRETRARLKKSADTASREGQATPAKARGVLSRAASGLRRRASR
ncbi:MAG: hypothetical protein ABJA81_12110 [Nocardioidaceae bacterium]